LESLKPLMISPRVRGQIEFLAKDLANVEKGELLFKLDESRNKSEIKKLTADLVAAQKRLADAVRNVEVETAQLEVELEKKKATLDLAEVKLEELQAGARPEDMLIARKDLEAAEAALAFADGELDDARNLLGKDFATQAEMDSKTLARAFALARFEKARMQFGLLQRGPTAHDLTPAELAVATAKIDVEVARERMKKSAASLRQTVAWRKSDTKAILEHRGRHQEQLKQGTVRARRAGLVVRTRRHRHGNRKTDVGDRVWPGRGILKFPDLTALKAATRIPEALVRLFSIGDEVTVIVDDIADERFKGRIVWIDSFARDRNSRLESADRKREGLSGVRVFRADIELLRIDKRMRLGSKLRVEMEHVIPNAVYVDRRAVLRRGGASFVRVVTGGSTVRLVPVVLGESNAKAFVVKSGLKSGERVAFANDVFGPATEVAPETTENAE
jgi:multidrug resistance efflux pump